MGDGYTVQRLVAKRAEIAGKIEHLQDEIRQLVADLNHLDPTIHVFDPSIELHEIRNRTVPPRHHAFRGEVTRIVLAALKEGQPVTTQEDPAASSLIRGSLCRVGLRNRIASSSYPHQRGPDSLAPATPRGLPGCWRRCA
jgi:hypothetical protein